MIDITGTDVVLCLVVGIGDRQLVVLRDRRPVGFLEPVSLVLEAVRNLHGSDLIHKFLVLGHIQDIECLGHLAETHIRGEVDLGADILRAFLCGDQDNSVGRP